MRHLVKRILFLMALIPLSLVSPATAMHVWELEGATVTISVERDGKLICDTRTKIINVTRICVQEFNNRTDIGGVHSYAISGEVIFPDGNVETFGFVDNDFNESEFGDPVCMPVLLRQSVNNYVLEINLACG